MAMPRKLYVPEDRSEEYQKEMKEEFMKKKPKDKPLSLYVQVFRYLEKHFTRRVSIDELCTQFPKAKKETLFKYRTQWATQTTKPISDHSESLKVKVNKFLSKVPDARLIDIIKAFPNASIQTLTKYKTDWTRVITPTKTPMTVIRAAEILRAHILKVDPTLENEKYLTLFREIHKFIEGVKDAKT